MSSVCPDRQIAARGPEGPDAAFQALWGPPSALADGCARFDLIVWLLCAGPERRRERQAKLQTLDWLPAEVTAEIGVTSFEQAEPKDVVRVAGGWGRTVAMAGRLIAHSSEEAEVLLLGAFTPCERRDLSLFVLTQATVGLERCRLRSSLWF